MWYLALLLAQDPSVIRVPVRLVAVPTLVFSKDNRLIPGLKQADFRVLDNGVPQSIHLDPDTAPVSIVIAVQTNLDARASIPYIAKVGSVMEAHLIGATGRAAVLAYDSDIKLLKPFGSGDVQRAFRALTGNGTGARMIDAGLEAIGMLKQRPRTQARVLLFIGQMMDHGSHADWAALQDQAEHENVSIYALSSSAGTDTAASPANKDLGWLLAILGRSRGAASDPVAPLIAATGGTELHFRHQSDLENAIGTMGVELRSAYQLSYSPTSHNVGQHTISVEVSVPGARTYTRPGYIVKSQMSPN